MTVTTETCKPAQNIPAGIQAGGRRLREHRRLTVSFTAYLKIRTASHYMDLHSNTQPIYFNFTLGSSEAGLLTVPVISKMWAGGRSFHFMVTVCFTMLRNWKQAVSIFKMRGKAYFHTVSYTWPTHTWPLLLDHLYLSGCELEWVLSLSHQHPQCLAMLSDWSLKISSVDIWMCVGV